MSTPREFYAQGIDGKDWYNEAAEFLDSAYPGEGDLMAAILAATSINATVKANVTLALKAYAQLKAGLEFTGFIPAAVQQLELAKNGLPLSGTKVENFRRALRGEPNAVVVDRWMLRAYGEEALTPAATRRVTALILQEAKAEGVEPRQWQAGVWCGIKRAFEGHNSDTRSFVELLADRLTQLELTL